MGGTAMYILVAGTATLSTASATRRLNPGESFGEGILLGLTKRSPCSVRAETACAFYEIPYQQFRMAFQATPDVIETMREQMRQQSANLLIQQGLGDLLLQPNAAEVSPSAIVKTNTMQL